MNLSNASLQEVLSNIRHSDVFLSKAGVDITKRDKKLSEALVEKCIDKNTTLATLNLLNGLNDEDIHWILEPTSNLISYIKDNYHNHHRLQLPILIALAEQVELNNRANPHCPLGLTDNLKKLHRDLLAHMENEEQILFPFLSAKQISYVFTQVSLALHNHDHEIDMLSKIDELTNGLNLPENADNTWRTLYFELSLFKKYLLEHIRLENDILFFKSN